MSQIPRFPVEKALVIADCLDRAAIPYAFGGAIALAYCGEPRGTADIDVNLFVSVVRAKDVLRTLAAVGLPAYEPEAFERLQNSDQLRIDWSGTAVDLYFSYAALHDSCRERARSVHVHDRTIRVLSAEDLVIFKAPEGRPRDWLDIEQVIRAQGPSFDHAYARAWLADIVGVGHPRFVRYDALLRQLSSS